MLRSIFDARRDLGGLGESTLRRRIAAGQIPIVRIGRRVFIETTTIRALVRRCRSRRRGAAAR
jgi:hypothetical protein